MEIIDTAAVFWSHLLMELNKNLSDFEEQSNVYPYFLLLWWAFCYKAIHNKYNSVLVKAPSVTKRPSKTNTHFGMIWNSQLSIELVEEQLNK